MTAYCDIRSGLTKAYSTGMILSHVICVGYPARLGRASAGRKRDHSLADVVLPSPFKQANRADLHQTRSAKLQ